MRLEDTSACPWSLAEFRVAWRVWWRDLCAMPARLSMKGKA